MALCEKYKKEVPLEKAVCPDPELFCDFRGSCPIYLLYEEGLKEGEEKDVA